MFSFRVETPQRGYDAIIQRGCLGRASDFFPAKGKLFVITTSDVWALHGEALKPALENRETQVLFFPGGEPRKRLVEVEALAEQMIDAGADRSSVVVAFGGGIVGDLGGFLAAIFMRGIPVIQVPTTLLAQVDACDRRGSRGRIWSSGKNLIGSVSSAAVGDHRSERAADTAGARVSRGAGGGRQVRRDPERGTVPADGGPSRCDRGRRFKTSGRLHRRRGADQVRRGDGR